MATSRMSEGARSTRYGKRSCIVASRIFFESMAATTSSSFSWDVTTIQHGRNDLVRLGEVLADLAELLHGRPQVFDLVAAAGDVLPHFVDDENQRLAGAAAAGKLEGPLDDLLHGDGGVAVPLGMRPRIRRRIRCRVQGMQDCAGTGDLLRPLAHHPPVLVVQLLAGGDELVQPALGLQFDLQLRDVEVLGIVQFAEQHRVHQLGDPLRHLSGVALFGDLEEDDLGGNPGIDGVEQVADPLVLDLLLEQSWRTVRPRFRGFAGQSRGSWRTSFSRSRRSPTPRRRTPLAGQRGLRQWP